MIICIPTLGRYSTKTYQLFESSGFTVYHFVEPQEFTKYNVPNMVDIKSSGMGISFVRNFINEWARINDHKFICVCDDDVNHFGKASNNKAVKMEGAEALKPVFNLFERSDFALAGVNQRQFAWSEKKSYRVNTGKMEVLQIINTKKAKWKFCEEGKEDRDYLMQCLDNRCNFVFFPKVFHSSPKIGSNQGGLHEYYQLKKDTESAYFLARKWGNYAKIVKHYGRVDCKLDYAQLAKDRGLKVI